MKDSVSLVSEKAVSNSVSEQNPPINRSRTRSPSCMKSVGSAENFWNACVVIYRMLFDSSMQVMWNAVFHDSIVEYSSAWRKIKLWSANNAIFEHRNLLKQYAGVVEKLPVEAVSGCNLALLYFAAFLLYVCCLKFVSMLNSCG